MTEDVTLNDVTNDLSTEALPDLSDFAEEHSGAWPKGHYKGVVIEGYSTKTGKTYQTEDTVSKTGDSRNLILCVKLTNAKGEDRTLRGVFNYRQSDFHPDRIAYIKEIRNEYKGVRGKWSDADAQRTSLALAKLGELQKAFGPIARQSDGTIIAGQFVGKAFDGYIVVDENGYNDIKGFNPVKEATAKK